MCALLANGDNEGGLTQPIPVYRTCSKDTHNVEHSAHTVVLCQKRFRTLMVHLYLKTKDNCIRRKMAML